MSSISSLYWHSISDDDGEGEKKQSLPVRFGQWCRRSQCNACPRDEDSIRISARKSYRSPSVDPKLRSTLCQSHRDRVDGSEVKRPDQSIVLLSALPSRLRRIVCRTANVDVDGWFRVWSLSDLRSRRDRRRRGKKPDEHERRSLRCSSPDASDRWESFDQCRSAAKKCPFGSEREHRWNISVSKETIGDRRDNETVRELRICVSFSTKTLANPKRDASSTARPTPTKDQTEIDESLSSSTSRLDVVNGHMPNKPKYQVHRRRVYHRNERIITRCHFSLISTASLSERRPRRTGERHGS